MTYHVQFMGKQNEEVYFGSKKTLKSTHFFFFMMCISCELLEGIGYKCIHVGLSSCSDEATCGGEALVPIHTFTNFLDFVRKTIPRVPWALQLCRGALEGLLTWTHWGWSLLCCLNSPSAGPCALFSPHSLLLPTPCSREDSSPHARLCLGTFPGALFPSW